MIFYKQFRYKYNSGGTDSKHMHLSFLFINKYFEILKLRDAAAHEM